MTRYVTRRLANMAAIWIGLTLLVFLLLRLAPGSPVDLLVGENPTPEQIRELNHRFGFDQPLYVQYFTFLSDIVHGRLGTSIAFQAPAADLVFGRLPATIELTLCATAITIALAIPLGVLMGVRRGTWMDRAGTVVAISGVSAPGFWVGVMLAIVFSVKLGWFATSGRGAPLPEAVLALLGGDPEPLGGSLRHLVLPAVTLAAFEMAFVSRIMRSTILEEIRQVYVRAARARGLPFYLVVAKHVVRNALLPVITVLGLELSGLIGGAVIIEAVFAWPGVGQLVYQAVSGRDYPLAQAGILIIGAFVIVINFLVDLSYGVIDPRIRHR
jgi:dipeptide transport system permease protein